MAWSVKLLRGLIPRPREDEVESVLVLSVEPACPLLFRNSDRLLDPMDGNKRSSAENREFLRGSRNDDLRRNRDDPGRGKASLDRASASSLDRSEATVAMLFEPFSELLALGKMLLGWDRREDAKDAFEGDLDVTAWSMSSLSVLDRLKRDVIRRRADEVRCLRFDREEDVPVSSLEDVRRRRRELPPTPGTGNGADGDCDGPTESAPCPGSDRSLRVPGGLTAEEEAAAEEALDEEEDEVEEEDEAGAPDVSADGADP